MSPYRKGLYGYHMPQDRLWLIHTPEFTAAITEYNQELTGFDPRLAKLDSAFHYSGNAYYILGTLAEQKGWRVESVEDRT